MKRIEGRRDMNASDARMLGMALFFAIRIIVIAPEFLAAIFTVLFLAGYIKKCSK